MQLRGQLSAHVASNNATYASTEEIAKDMYSYLEHELRPCDDTK